MTDQPAAPAAPATYAERLTVPLIWWFIPIFWLVVFGAGFMAYLGPLAAVLLMVAMIAFVVWVLIAYGAKYIRVTPERFSAGDAWLPLGAVGAVYPLDAEQARALRGPRSDARAFMLLRGYVPLAVRVDVDDPDDPVPYWYVSTRRPVELAAALIAARDRAKSRPTKP